MVFKNVHVVMTLIKPVHQICLMRAVQLCPMKAKEQKSPYTASNGSDQTTQMYRLIKVFVGCMSDDTFSH